MPNFSELAAASGLTDADIVAIFQDATTKRTTIGDLRSLLSVPAGGSNGNIVSLDAFTGSDRTAKFRDMLSKIPGYTYKPSVFIPPGTTLDAGTTPFVLPVGLDLVGTAGSENEFGHGCPVFLRHTGATNDATKGVFKTGPRGSSDSTDKGWKMKGISFLGTGSVKAFVDNPLNASGGVWAYVTLDNVSWNQFQSIACTPMLGVQITGTTYMNNVGGGTEPPWRIGGSDNNLFTDGGFFECGGVGTYSSRAQVPAMIDCGSLSKTRFGAVYITGSPTSPFRLAGGEGGVTLADMTLEGRPVPGTGNLWCAGALARLEGGSMRIANKWHGFAMRAPADKSAGGLPLDGGFYHITGGDHVITGGTFQPYTAATYGGTVPPFVYITGGHVRISDITLGPNAAGVKPVVKYANASMVDADSSVTLSII